MGFVIVNHNITLLLVNGIAKRWKESVKHFDKNSSNSEGVQKSHILKGRLGGRLGGKEAAQGWSLQSFLEKRK